jgi:hypothetical protein
MPWSQRSSRRLPARFGMRRNRPSEATSATPARRASWPAIATELVQPHIATMPYHRFKVGQTVVAPSGGLHALIPRGLHVIVRLLPLAGREAQYRVRSEADGLERVVLESQITVWAPPSEKPAPPKPFQEPPRQHRTKR